MMLQRWLIGAVIFVVLVVSAYAKGWFDGVAHADAKWETKVAEMRAAAVKEQTRLQVLSDKLGKEVSSAQEQIFSMAAEISTLLRRRVSSTRRVLDSDLTRMLNTTTPIRETVTPIAGANEAPAAPAANRDRHPPKDDGSGSSERAVVVALVQARAGYEACRTQLHKLIDWVEVATR